MTGKRLTDSPRYDAPDTPRRHITPDTLDASDASLLAELRQQIADGDLTEDAARSQAKQMGLRW